MIPLLVGVLVAAGCFAAALWSLAQCFRTSGSHQIAHVAVSLGVVAGMAAISWGLSLVGAAIGALLLMAALRAIWSDPGWSRILPGFAAIFGAVLLIGLPFGAV